MESLWCFQRYDRRFLFFQKSYGNTIPMIFFYAQFFFSVTGTGIFGHTDQILFWYDRRPPYMILGKRGNFCESKLLWAYNGLKLNFERFFGFKSPMGTLLDSIFFTHNFFFSVTGSDTFGRTDQKKIRYDQRPSYMIRSDWFFFIFVKFYGNKTRINFFYPQNLFPVAVLGPARYPNQNLLQYDQRPNYIFFFETRKFLVCQNSCGHTMVLCSFLGEFFVSVRLHQKVASYWLVLVVMHKNSIKISQLIVCEVFKDTASDQEDINFLMRIILIWILVRQLKRFRLDFRGKW